VRPRLPALARAREVAPFAAGLAARPWASRLVRALTATWTLGVLAAFASWNVRFAGPIGGLDPSWWAGLYMAAERGMDFGTHLVFSFGPLGFLRLPWLWYEDLAVLAFLYSGALRVLLSVSLVWALRRTLGGPAALLLAFLILVVGTSIEVPIVLTAVWCLAALSPEPPRFARPLVVFGGAALGAIETLVLLRSGPIVLGMCAITVLAQERWRRDLPAFVGCSALVIVLLWLAAGQGLSNLSDFVRTAWETISGYSEAMGVPASSGLHLPVILVVGVVLVVAAAWTSAGGRARLAAAVATGGALFLLYKEAVVRAEPGHVAVFFGTALGLGASLAFGRRRLLAVVAVVILCVLALRFPLSGHPSVDLNPIAHARDAVDQVGVLLSPARRERLTRDGRILMAAVYGLRPSTLGLLREHTVHVDPWEAAVVWTYGLRWEPLPVFQDYSAYTTALDQLNAETVRSQDAPDRILRANTARGASGYQSAAVDSRYPAWDPPEQSLAMLCNYVPLQTTARWQVLGKVPDRCGVPQRLGSTNARYGEPVRIPTARRGGVVFVRVRGAEVSGFERLRTLLYRASLRYVVVNGRATYRLVPGTARDGLIVATAPRVDYPAPFALAPGARTIELRGRSGELQVDFYWMRVGPALITAAQRSGAPRG
jgi:hypothetical protein